MSTGNKGAQGTSQSSDHKVRPASSLDVDDKRPDKRLRVDVDVDRHPLEDMAALQARVMAELAANLIVIVMEVDVKRLCSSLDSRFWILDSRFWILDSGF